MRSRGPGGRAIGLSLLIHAIVIAPVVVFARAPEPVVFETVKINLVASLPAQALAESPTQPAPQPVAQPEPEQVAPEPEVTVEEEPPPKPKPPEPEVERPKTETPPETPPQTSPAPRTAPDADASGGDAVNINTEGREFPYPDYLANVIEQVHRYFRWSGDGHPRALVYFEIARDGSARNIRMVRGSGNMRFDFAVQGAIETAGNRGAFGPLPEGFLPSTLPVQLEVEPPR